MRQTCERAWTLQLFIPRIGANLAGCDLDKAQERLESHCVFPCEADRRVVEEYFPFEGHPVHLQVVGHLVPPVATHVPVFFPK